MTYAHHGGTRNPNRRGGGNRECLACGGAFWVKPSHADKRKCCSRKCAAAHCKTTGRLAGSRNPAFGKIYTGSRPERRTCIECGSGHVRLVGSRHRFCSKPCAARANARGRDTSGSKNPNWRNGSAISGPKNPNWRGGLTTVHHAIRVSPQYQAWRADVMRRDRWTCVQCGYRSRGRGDIHADHIKPFALFPDERFNVSNGRTLCAPCHRATATYGNGSKTGKRQATLADLAS